MYKKKELLKTFRRLYGCLEAKYKEKRNGPSTVDVKRQFGHVTVSKIIQE